MAHDRTGARHTLLQECQEGMTDGGYKKIVHNRGGIVEDTTARERAELADIWYGVHEAESKIAPDGTTCRTPYTTPNEKAQISV